MMKHPSRPVKPCRVLIVALNTFSGADNRRTALPGLRRTLRKNRPAAQSFSVREEKSSSKRSPEQ
ncbi:MAG: hypothetical protein ABIW02_01045, partial [Nitrosospira sp.]